jgi:hypothetical protein
MSDRAAQGGDTLAPLEAATYPIRMAVRLSRQYSRRPGSSQSRLPLHPDHHDAADTTVSRNLSSLRRARQRLWSSR